MSNMKKIDSKLLGSILMFIIPIAMGIIYYNQLPNEMAVHFDSQNVPNGFAPKWFALFGLPVLLLVIHVFSIFMIQNDPKKNGQSKVVKGLMYWFVPVLSIVMEAFLIAYGVGKIFDMNTYALLGVGILTIIAGNYLPKSRQNCSIGIRLPWTLSSEENWNKTHRMAGKLWVVSGMLISLLALLGYSNILLLVVLVMVLVPSIYSYVLYRNVNKSNG